MATTRLNRTEEAIGEVARYRPVVWCEGGVGFDDTSDDIRRVTGEE